MKAYRKPSRIQSYDDSFQSSILNKAAVNCNGITTRSIGVKKMTSSFDTVSIANIPDKIKASYIPFRIDNNHKNSNQQKCFDDLSFKELLNVSNLVDLGIKGLPVPEHYSKKEIRCAGRIVSLYHKKGNKNRAEGLISDLNHKIILENKKGLDRSEGKKLLDDLMK